MLDSWGNFGSFSLASLRLGGGSLTSDQVLVFDAPFAIWSVLKVLNAVTKPDLAASDDKMMKRQSGIQVLWGAVHIFEIKLETATRELYNANKRKHLQDWFYTTSSSSSNLKPAVHHIWKLN